MVSITWLLLELYENPERFARWTSGFWSLFFFFFWFEGSAISGSGPLWRSKSIFDAEAGPPHVRLQCRSKVASKTNVRLQNLYLWLWIIVKVRQTCQATWKCGIRYEYSLIYSDRSLCWHRVWMCTDLHWQITLLSRVKSTF